MAHLSHLSDLESAGLIRLASIEPELEYLFRHVLVQEAAYESLIKTDRRRLHRHVGEALEGLYTDRLDDLAPLLGNHFLEAGDEARALRYFALAGRNAGRRYAHPEAIAFFRRAIELARGTSDPEGEWTPQHLYGALGRELELAARHPEAVQVYLEMEAAARELGDRATELEAMIRRATVLVTPSNAMDLETGAALCERALGLAREHADRAAEARILWNLLLLNSENGRAEDAVRYGEESLAIARELNLRQQAAYTLNDLSGALMFFGQVERAAQTLEEARAYWAETGNRPMLADNLGRAGMVKFIEGRLRESLRLSEESLAVSRSIGNRWGESFATLTIGWTRQMLGEVDEALQALEASIRLSEHGGFTFPQVGARLFRATMYGEMGDPARGMPDAEAALKFAREIYPSESPPSLAILARLHIRLGEFDLARRGLNEAQSLLAGQTSSSFGPDFVYLAEVEWHLAQGQFERGLSHLDRYLQSDRFSGLIFYRPLALRYKAEMLHGQGHFDEAREALRQAKEEAERRESPFELWPIFAVLASVETAQGRADEAEAALERAREAIRYIAAHSPPDLRASFLNSAGVRKALGAGADA